MSGSSGTFIRCTLLAIALQCGAGLLSAQWTAVNNGLSDTWVFTFLVKGNVLYAGTKAGGVFRTTNDGAEWTQTSNGLPTSPESSLVRTLVASGDSLFAGGGSYISGVVFVSTDDGAHWKAADSGFAGLYVFALFIDKGTLYAGADNGVYATPLGSVQWAAKNNGLASKSMLSLVTCADVLLAGMNGSGIYRSSDGGENWLPSAQTSGSIHQIIPSGSMLFAAAVDHGVLVSLDSGAHWTSVSSGLPLYTSVYTVAESKGVLFAGLESKGVFTSTNNGESWQSVSDGLPAGTSVLRLTTKNKYLYAGTYQEGIWRRPLAELVGVQNSRDEQPLAFGIHSVFPNPFSSSALIEFEIPIAQPVSLLVYNMLNQKIATPFNGPCEAGRHTATFASEHFPAGAYWCRINYGGQAQSTKLMVIH